MNDVKGKNDGQKAHDITSSGWNIKDTCEKRETTQLLKSYKSRVIFPMTDKASSLLLSQGGRISLKFSRTEVVKGNGAWQKSTIENHRNKKCSALPSVHKNVNNG